MVGMVCSRNVLSPVIQVIVPSPSLPASASILGASAASRIGQGVAPGTVRLAVTRNSLPEWLTLPVRMSGASTAMYSFMCVNGLAKEKPSMPSMTT
jgi:hypothetical protein